MAAATVVAMDLSIIIPTRKEPANLWFTLQGLLQLLHPMRLTHPSFEWEIIVADNEPVGTKQVGAMRPTKHGTNCSKIVGDLHDPRVRYLSCPETKSPYHPRNRGAEEAKGKWLLFLDSHVLMSPGFFERVAEMIVAEMIVDGYPENAIVHYPVVFNDRRRKWGHYKLKLDTDFWGSWGPSAPTARSLKPIGATGIWAMCMTREWYLDDLQGFNPLFRGYSGGEPYLDLKSWMLGGQVLMDSAVFGSHYSGPRGYGTNWPDRIRNFALAIYVIDPSYIQTFAKHYLRKVNKAVVEDAIQEGQRLALDEAASFKIRRRRTLAELLIHFESKGIPH